MLQDTLYWGHFDTHMLRFVGEISRYKGRIMWRSEVNPELSRAIAEERTALAAVLSDLRRQKVLCFAPVRLSHHIK